MHTRTLTQPTAAATEPRPATYGDVVSVPSDTVSPRTSRKKRTPVGSGELTLVSFTTVTVVNVVFGK